MFIYSDSNLITNPFYYTYYGGCNLMGSLWDRQKLITLMGISNNRIFETDNIKWTMTITSFSFFVILYYGYK
jgi:hypothetical protein